MVPRFHRLAVSRYLRYRVGGVLGRCAFILSECSMTLEEQVSGSTLELADRIAQWRVDYVRDINDTFSHASLSDSQVVASMLKANVDDMRTLFQWCEVLARKVEKLENKTV